MAGLGEAFDASQNEEMGNFDAIPSGEYLCKIIKSEIKDTKAKDGKYIQLEFEVLQGDYKGRKLWTNLNRWNKSAQAVEIAKKEMTSICMAVGKPVVQDTNEWHGIPMIVTVKLKPAKDDWPPSNQNSGYKPANGKAVAPSSAAGAKKPAGGGMKNPAKKVAVEKPVEDTTEPEPGDEGDEAFWDEEAG